MNRDGVIAWQRATDREDNLDATETSERSGCKLAVERKRKGNDAAGARYDAKVRKREERRARGMLVAWQRFEFVRVTEWNESSVVARGRVRVAPIESAVLSGP